MITRELTTLPDGFAVQPRTSGQAVVVAVLSPRELEILQLIAEGYRDREIAARLYLSHHTVANHVRNILAKLDVQSRAAAIGQAIRAGLI
jgi:DNA-binding CsgD family transcriptional regulator